MKTEGKPTKQTKPSSESTYDLPFSIKSINQPIQDINTLCCFPLLEIDLFRSRRHDQGHSASTSIDQNNNLNANSFGHEEKLDRADCNRKVKNNLNVDKRHEDDLVKKERADLVKEKISNEEHKVSYDNSKIIQNYLVESKEPRENKINKTKVNRRLIKAGSNEIPSSNAEKPTRVKQIIFEAKGDSFTKIKPANKQPGSARLNNKNGLSSNSNYIDGIESRRNSYCEINSQAKTKSVSSFKKLG